MFGLSFRCQLGLQIGLGFLQLGGGLLQCRFGLRFGIALLQGFDLRCRFRLFGFGFRCQLGLQVGLGFLQLGGGLLQCRFGLRFSIALLLQVLHGKMPVAGIERIPDGGVIAWHMSNQAKTSLGQVLGDGGCRSHLSDTIGQVEFGHTHAQPLAAGQRLGCTAQHRQSGQAVHDQATRRDIADQSIQRLGKADFGSDALQPGPQSLQRFRR